MEIIKSLQRGILIAIEGIDGSGKSTLARNLYNKLQEGHIPALITKEPGGTPLGMQLRKILHEKPFDFCPKAEYLLFAADRAQHMNSIVQPALEENKIVISDRMGDSSIVYQGHARGLDVAMIDTINKWAMNGIQPDLIFYVHLSPEQAIERIKQRNEALTSFEKEGEAFIKALVKGFDKLFASRSNIIYLNGTHSPESLTEQAVEQLSSWIAHHHEQ